MNATIGTVGWDGIDRRKPNSCRRKHQDRRTKPERRCDPRKGQQTKRPLVVWFRSMTKSRLGVDRRKGQDQRTGDRRCYAPGSMLMQEEIEALLSD